MGIRFLEEFRGKGWKKVGDLSLRERRELQEVLDVYPLEVLAEERLCLMEAPSDVRNPRQVVEGRIRRYSQFIVIR